VSADLKIPCPACNGDGFVSFGDRHVENRTESCETCGGRGEVPAMTGQTPQTSAAPDGGLHTSFSVDTPEKLADLRRGVVHVDYDTEPVNTGVPAVVSPHSGE
jgi:DnaJ-class molecular chaperone